VKTRIDAAYVFKDSTLSLACSHHPNHGDAPLHSHQFHELVIVLTGNGRHRTEKEEYPIQAGDTFLIRGNMKHGYTDVKSMALVNVLFNPTRLGLPMSQLRDLPGYHALFRIEPKLRDQNRFQHRLRLTPGELTEVSALVAQIVHETKSRSPGYRFQACAHLMTLLTYISRSYSRPDRHTDRPLLHMGQVLSFIEQHYKETITIQQLTRLAHMSESTLMRTFKQVLNRSPIEHVIHVRVQKSVELLKQGDVRVTDAAYACGFSDSNYFSRQFRKVMGLSPKDYRTRYR
jgi:AraC-like DNA-binding protein